MSSFLRNLKYMSNNREQQIIKSNLLTQLSENAKEIQYEFNKKCNDDCIELTDCTNSLCTTLEAIFLHGLKDSFLSQTMNVISGGDNDRRPNPNFWPILLIFLHAHTIEQIESWSQITTDIGKCRSWIRLSLNESLFSSYLNTIRKNSSALIPYYKKYSFLKDSENLDVASKILEGIEVSVKINLPINTTLLNEWTNLSLQLSGIWTPPLISYQVATGIDLANSITDNISIPTPQPLQTKEFFSESISNSPFNQYPTTSSASTTIIKSTSDLNDHENLQLFLQKIDQMDEILEEDNDKDKFIDNNDKKLLNNHQININNDNLIQKSNDNNIKYTVNNLNSSWSDDKILIENDNLKKETNNNTNNLIKNDNTNNTNTNNNRNNISRSNSMTTSMNSIKSPITERYSYNTLLIKHETNRSRSQLFDIQDVWERFENSLSNRRNSINDENSINNTQPDDDNLDFEIVTKSMVEQFTITELKEMIEALCKLSREYGLANQGFVCKICAHPLGIGFANAQVCAFTGNYYCESCISTEQYIIPAKIIYNFDFRRYTVSKRAAIFLTEFQNQPFIDFKILNPDIYQASDEMANLQSLRIQLNFIRAYLYTCCESTINELEKYVKSKSYLYEHIHQYSIGDLIMIQRGQLEQLLYKTVQFGEQHILQCNLCSVKGFICEICNNPQVLYPFHINTTYRCPVCGAVFHSKCLNQSEPCPKCDRKRKREDLPLMEAVHML